MANTLDIHSRDEFLNAISDAGSKLIDPPQRRALVSDTFGGVATFADLPSKLHFHANWATFSSELLDQIDGRDAAPDCPAVGLLALKLLNDVVGEHRERLTELIKRHGWRPYPKEDACHVPAPSRADELAHLDALVVTLKTRARRYGALAGKACQTPAHPTAQVAELWVDDELLSGLRHRSRRAQCDPPEQVVETPYTDILDAFGEVSQAALLGPPGAGKSTTLARLATDLARRARDDDSAPIPLLADLKLWTNDAPLDAFLIASAPHLGRGLFALAADRRLVLLLDALNQVPTPKREAKAEELRGLLRALPADTPLFVAARTDDYDAELDQHIDRLDLDKLTPPRIRQILHNWYRDAGHDLAEEFFWELAGDPRLKRYHDDWLALGVDEEALWEASDPWQAFGQLVEAAQAPNRRWWDLRRLLHRLLHRLLRRLLRRSPARRRGSSARSFALLEWDTPLWVRHRQEPHKLLDLAGNPFMLTMLSEVWVGNKGRLPRNRGPLLGEFVDTLLKREALIADRQGPGAATRLCEQAAKDLIQGLGRVAADMQGFADEQVSDIGSVTVRPRERVLQLLGGDDRLKAALDATLLESNRRDGEIQIGFRHQLLQEYFMALGLSQAIDAGQIAAAKLFPRDSWWQRRGWEEVVLLLAGLRADDCAPILCWLRDAQPELAARCWLEAEEPTREAARLRELHADNLAAELRAAWLPRLTDRESDPMPEARAAVGRALGLLRLDDRPGVGLRADGLPDIDWVDIPGGEFIYQDSERRTVEAFSIARYPVTHAQFDAFLQAGDGYADERWWKGLTNPDRAPEPARWPITNHPRANVNWYEAMAFCAWLSHRLGETIRLPTEWEWERAARGTEGRAYPWGSEYQAGRANIDEHLPGAGPHSLGRTSAVGIYPHGTTVTGGINDLSGNIMEWCLDADPEHTDRSGTGSRVVRGGSWLSIPVFARAAYRYFRFPDLRFYLYGFRLLRGALSAEHRSAVH